MFLKLSNSVVVIISYICVTRYLFGKHNSSQELKIIASGRFVVKLFIGELASNYI